jgi:hypothetical protein
MAIAVNVLPIEPISNRVSGSTGRGAARSAPDDDLTRRGGCLEPGGDVDGVADDDRLARAAGADDDGAGVDARSRVEGDAALPAQPDLQPFERLTRRRNQDDSGG